MAMAMAWWTPLSSVNRFQAEVADLRSEMAILSSEFKVLCMLAGMCLCMCICMCVCMVIIMVLTAGYIASRPPARTIHTTGHRVHRGHRVPSAPLQPPPSPAIGGCVTVTPCVTPSTPPLHAAPPPPPPLPPSVFSQKGPTRIPMNLGDILATKALLKPVKVTS